MRSPEGISLIGSWKTTRSIGRECKAGDRLSRPVLTAERLDHPDQIPARGPIDGAVRSASEASLAATSTISRSEGTVRSEHAANPKTRVSTHTEIRPAGLNPPAGRIPGDHTCGATPVPIPNTAVKPAGPMIVQSRESRSSPGSHIEKPILPKGRMGFFVAPQCLTRRPDIRPRPLRIRATRLSIAHRVGICISAQRNLQ